MYLIGEYIGLIREEGQIMNKLLFLLIYVYFAYLPWSWDLTLTPRVADPASDSLNKK